MDEREKIKAALEQGSKAFSAYFRSELRKALDGGKGHFGTKDTAKTVVDFVADALITAGIGDVTEYKETICDLNTDVVAYRALSKADTLEQIIEGQKSLIDEYKHRAEVAEEERDKAQKSLVALCNEVAKIAIASDLVAIDNNTHKFFACKSDWSGTCKKCYFSCENYPFDMGRCEHNQYHWLNQQAEREIEEEK